MRAALSRFVPTLALSLAACAPGTVVYVPAPRPTPVYEPPPAPDPIEPLEITIGHPVRGRLLVQTNRPAYVALFEVVPEVGIRLVHPSSSRESRFVLSGLSSVPIWWSPTRPGASRARTVASSPTRYIYAVASDEPLRLPSAAFQEGYFRRTLGSRVFHSASPYTTMRALSRQVLPHVADEEWAEDAFIMEATHANRPVRLARVYCPDGTIYEVPAAMADRVLCPRNTRVVVVHRPHEQSVPPGRRIGDVPDDDRPVRPDSVIGDDNRRVPPPVKRGRGPIDRLTEPVQAGRAGRGPVGDGPPREHPGGGNANGRDNGNANGRDNGNANGRNNGNSNGHANGHAAEPTPPRAVPAVPAVPGNTPAVPAVPANTPARPGDAAPGRGNAPQGPPAPASGAEREDRPAATPAATKDSVKAARRPEPKPESKPETKPETKPESKAEAKPETKAESKAETKAESKAETKPDAKPESKPEAKEQKGPQRGGAEEADAEGSSAEPAAQPDSSSAKPAPRKPKPNSNRPPRG